MKIKNIELQNTGGHCMVLYIEIEHNQNEMTIGLNDECICLYDDPLSEVEKGEACEYACIYMIVGNPWKDLGDIIGQKNSGAIKLIYNERYKF